MSTFARHEAVFTASEATPRLEFINTSPQDLDRTVFIDDISICKLDPVSTDVVAAAITHLMPSISPPPPHTHRERDTHMHVRGDLDRFASPNPIHILGGGVLTRGMLRYCRSAHRSRTLASRPTLSLDHSRMTSIFLSLLCQPGIKVVE